MMDIVVRPEFHLGHRLKAAMEQYSTLLCQIDAATGEEETYASVLHRSVQLAKCLRNFGLKPGDVVAVGGWNHLDISIPIYSAIFNGATIIGVVPYYKYDEIKDVFAISKPKLAFCERNFFETYCKVTKVLKLNTKVIAFGRGDDSWAEFIETFDDDEPEENFKIEEFDVDKIHQFLVPTSGSTGGAKVAAFIQPPFVMRLMCHLSKYFSRIQQVRGFNSLHLTPVHSIANFVVTLSYALLGLCKVQTSVDDDIYIVINMINKYKPTSTYVSPHLMAEILKRKNMVDLTCFNLITGIGERFHPKLICEIKECMKKESIFFESCGQTETVGTLFEYATGCPIGSCGKLSLPFLSIRLIDPASGSEVTEPHVPGELWVKGPCLQEYYNDPEETRAAFTEEGYFKTGDLYYRDENSFYYFASRIKTIIKWRACTLFPGQIEDVIRTHEGVSDVCVVGLKHPEDGERPVACVKRRAGSNISAQEIKDLVIEKLSVKKELRGGVVFLEEFPMTSSGKISRKRLLDIASNSLRE